ncbi:hypothetical protein [Alicyclobacillus sp. SO9]|uniref:hypothetical protein n=1 Tax=Alicyclobacillus sp. SO9 TaxID=2665646 RepID=UPI0018E7CA2E|nr:hypothetical protein [Alicyclobacillus sp. SO9]QQE77655.1 hypothetical protein GI364_17190 [Alicyclobacillus sp. SO9]
MYAVHYDRLCGWIFLFFSIAGFSFGHVGEYMQLSLVEDTVFLILGVLLIVSARSRYRYAVAAAFSLGLLCTVWGLWGTISPASVPGSADPLENAVRVVLGAWGVYTSAQDIRAWRRLGRS